ncbi:MAG: response regulator transcription factor [Kineosporiaceae bacterium]
MPPAVSQGDSGAGTPEDPHGVPGRCATARVLVAARVSLVRAGMVALLDREAGLDAVAEACSAAEALAVARTTSPCVVLVDEQTLADHDPSAWLAALRTATGSGRVVLVTASPDVVRAAAAAGFDGLAHPDVHPRQLADILRAVHDGGIAYDPRLLAPLLSNRAASPLSPGEQRVLREIADGHRVRDVAGRLFLSEGTVRNYVSAVIRKSGARNRVDAIRIARAAGWI